MHDHCPRTLSRLASTCALAFRRHNECSRVADSTSTNPPPRPLELLKKVSEISGSIGGGSVMLAAHAMTVSGVKRYLNIGAKLAMLAMPRSFGSD